MNIDNRFVVGYLTPGQASAGFCKSLVELACSDKNFTGLIARTNGVDLCRGRNILCQSFMETDVPWLLMLDSDITFPANVFDELSKVASPSMIAVAPYCSFNSDTREVKSTVYSITPALMDDLGNFPVHGAGAGCMLIHRDTFAQIPRPWFTQHPEGDYLEDIGFCNNARAAGIKLVCVPSVGLGHSKQITIWPEDYCAYQLQQAHNL